MKTILQWNTTGVAKKVSKLLELVDTVGYPR
jgi:hypothetical protein